MQWNTTSLNSSLKISINSNIQKYSSSIENEVNTIWNNKRKQYPNLFNGRVFNIEQLNTETITGYWTEYRYVLAQTEKPELYPDLSIRSLAVIGLIKCPDGFILGKRTVKSVYLPGYWQSPPAGTVESREGKDNVDLHTQLYAEAEEELGLHQSNLINPRIISATEHTNTHIIDIGILLETKLSFQQIQTIWQVNNNPEYDEILCCSQYSELPENTLPTTQFLIQNWRF
ncbi:NUDIX hydrolase [Commensalibacter papalotli (ex Servin-Garciduenas et al. 2014)]|uniref:NUDIX hydrolase n=1 Tax=Commensalibacter papalotli (ex Servin-Garciduenas et al. 2014) TaxID=1208583 RepID=W7DV00_9PROT|nr:hypothetical protein [Commensalibacter papalotli (ex Servin-Garciduenas et al. 2014)]EUK18835.1 NUDIX hydrolase [Commensalibacter papalotli (ex Servin-Garciduenas et al. 2014)]